MSTGKSSQDYNKRVVIIAENIRRLFFGSPDETYFYYESFNGVKASIPLPTLQGRNKT
jgi:hypothetical protein